VSTGRSTTVRDRDRRAIARTKAPCGIYLLHGPGDDECSIDYSLKSPDPMSFEVDHIIPFGPNPTPERIAELDVLSNKQASHRKCNREKWDRLAEAGGPRVFITTRTW